MNKPVKELLLEHLQFCKGKPLAVHEIHLVCYGLPVMASQNNVATRLAELAKEGKIAGRFRAGKNFKEWYILTKKEQQEIEALEEEKANGQLMLSSV